MITNGAVNLKNFRKEIDHLNVFPVPDGDTGTNMQMTMMSGIKEVNNLESESILDISKILSRGLLMGARGNSGVILSQFFRGLYDDISKKGKDVLTVEDLISSLVSGYKMAYNAVINPVEGTILTVIREAADNLNKNKERFDSIEQVLNEYLYQCNETLRRTPDLLPVLKEAGVVDSGGAGFIKIVEGMLLAVNGNMLKENEVSSSAEESNYYEGAHNLGDIEITFGYCTEFIVKLFHPAKFSENLMRDPLSQLGDSLVVVTDEDILKIHVHTNQPGVALTLAQKYGDIQTVKVENMRVQHSSIIAESKEILNKAKEHTKYGIIVVSSGAGIKEAFKSLGADYVIDGGQTLNPSTECFINAINELNCSHYIIFPNNSNIIMAANQTKSLLPDKDIRVVKTKSIASGYSSLIYFDPTLEIDDNLAEFDEVLSRVKSGEVTYSIRNANLNGLNIKKNNYIGILDNQMTTTSQSRIKTTKELIKKMADEQSMIITIFYGKDVKEDEIKEIEDFVRAEYSDIEVELVSGGQDIYSYIISVE
jgi:DAK2 domain fusion protein YloV